MVTEDQSDVIALLSQAETFGGATVDRIETHSAIVFLAGSRAWKLKRAVRYDYLDFSSRERRKASCDAEVRLNRRTAPALYRGVVAVTREADGSLALAGSGSPVDWVVEMNRFDQGALFDRLALGGGLTIELMSALGAEIARFHRAAEERVDHGGDAGMRWVIDGNALGFAEFGERMLDRSACERLTASARAELARVAPLLDRRRRRGFVRQCHGDLHLRNIVLLDGRPTLFDGVEFNDQIACVDVMYDLAFLLMDLWKRALRGHANAVLNSYLAEAGDLDGLRGLPLFLSCRAAVRAKTSATSARLQADERAAGDLQRLAHEYLAMAERLLHPPPPRLVAIGGLSGSGKSTLARALAPLAGRAPGAVVLRSDAIRKQVCGVRPVDRLGPEGYAPEVSQRVYRALAERAALIVAAGHSAIADAVYARPEDRAAIERVAANAGVPFDGVWLEAPEQIMIDRVGTRGRDASDADAAVVRLQHAQETGSLGAWRRIDAARSSEAVLDAVAADLGIDHAELATQRSC